ncbi:MAG: FeoB-associated Cys-rich membrane protein [Lachnospiraceae bacterium]|nr:FeoB-associated Cys-rich membrane protein [Lachnospiraceae bacterium]
MDVLVALIIILILTFSIIKIRKEKKKGVRCIGCPSAGTCSGAGGGQSKCTCNAGYDEME